MIADSAAMAGGEMTTVKSEKGGVAPSGDLMVSSIND